MKFELHYRQKLYAFYIYIKLFFVESKIYSGLIS
jgi:hypothetical protein